MAHHDRNTSVEDVKIYSPQFSGKVIKLEERNGGLFNVCLALDTDGLKWIQEQQQQFPQIKTYGQNNALIYVNYWQNEDNGTLRIQEKILTKLQIKQREYNDKQYVNITMYKNASLGMEKAILTPKFKAPRSPVKPQLKREESSKPPVKRQLQKTY
jgi:hypothetical protein